MGGLNNGARLFLGGRQTAARLQRETLLGGFAGSGSFLVVDPAAADQR